MRDGEEVIRNTLKMHEVTCHASTAKSKALQLIDYMQDKYPVPMHG